MTSCGQQETKNNSLTTKKVENVTKDTTDQKIPFYKVETIPPGVIFLILVLSVT